MDLTESRQCVGDKTNGVVTGVQCASRVAINRTFPSIWPECGECPRGMAARSEADDLKRPMLDGKSALALSVPLTPRERPPEIKVVTRDARALAVEGVGRKPRQMVVEDEPKPRQRVIEI